MTKNKDEKRRVRARMAKTGESYTAAKAQLQPHAKDDPSTYADRAGMKDASVEAKTGLDWAGWVKALDAAGASELSHRDIAKTVGARWPEIGGWWAQSVTVGYERIRGLREKGQQRTTKLFDANKSRTFSVPVETLYRAFSESRRRLGWLGELTPIVRSSSKFRSARLDWPDGTRVDAHFVDKGPQKSAVSVQHRGLASSQAATAEKAAWAARFDVLRAYLNKG